MKTSWIARCGLVSVSFFFVAPQLAPGDPPATTTAPIAATPRGECAKAFIAMINEGTPTSVEAFEKAWASQTRLGTSQIADRAARVAQINADVAPLTILGVEAQTTSAITISVRTRDGTPASLEFRFSDKEESKLDTVLITAGTPAESHPLDAIQRRSAVRAAAEQIASIYVTPEMGTKMSAAILTKLDAGAYDEIKTDVALARALTEDMRAVSHDRHLAVVTAPSDAPAREPLEEARPDNNYTFRKVEILPGNIGLLAFHMFPTGDGANRAAMNAMGFLANVDALIVDLRTNDGGQPEMIAFLTSYLFRERTHLNDMVDRDGKVTREWWTLSTLPEGATRLKDNIPVYVLIGPRSFSGAEEFAYNLQALKRATIIGQPSGGGAHPTRQVKLGERLAMFVPYERARNPITHTNWEGVGVKPDVECPASEALDRAQALARKSMKRALDRAKP